MVGVTKWCVVIVHGTWAHRDRSSQARIVNHDLAKVNILEERARWFEVGSRFLSMLHSTLKKFGDVINLDSFIWSGQNSLSHREEASKMLAEHIEITHGKHPESNVLIIAHSHGGNVAVSALNKIQDLSYIHTVTIGTPFLTIYPPSVPRPKISRLIMWWSSLCALALLLNIFSIASIEWSGTIIFAAIFGCIISILSQFKTIKKNNGVIPGDVSRLTEITSSECLQGKEASLLILRAINDEAGALIGFAASSSLFSKWLSDKCLAGLSYLPLIAFPMAAIAVIFAYLGVIGADALLTGLPFWLIIGLSVLLTITGFGIFFAALCNVAYAHELRLRFHDIEIGLNSVPDFEGNIKICTVTRGNSETFRMRHALYNDDKCLERTREWLITKI